MLADMSNDLAWGVDEIAKAIGRDARATYHLLSAQRLPAKKGGGRWVASRSRLREFLTGGAF